MQLSRHITICLFSALVGSCAKHEDTTSTGSGSISVVGSGSSITGSGSSTGSGSAAGSGSNTTSVVAAGSGSGSGSSTANAGTFKVGDLVYAMWEKGDDWYPGKIGAINADGTYRIDYNDGDVSPHATAKRIKSRAAPKQAPAKPSGCPGELTLCDGRCVDLYSDAQNCFACGRTCPEGTECRGGGCAEPL